MLHLSLHAGVLGDAAFNNTLGFVDMAARQRSVLQDYKFAFFTSRQPAAPIIELAKYPRYSASVWDLVGRAIALHLHEREQAARREQSLREHALAVALSAELGMPEPPPPPKARITLTEQSPDFLPSTLRPAYATRMCAVLERAPDAKHDVPEVLATVEIECKNKRSGLYSARFEEPGFDANTVTFVHAPAALSHWRLLLAAIGHRLCGQDRLPIRPRPIIPESSETEAGAPGSSGSDKLVRIDAVAQPCRTWLCKWLREREDYFSLEQGVVAETAVIEFLARS